MMLKSSGLPWWVLGTIAGPDLFEAGQIFLRGEKAVWIYKLIHDTFEDHSVILDHEMPVDVRRAYEELGYQVEEVR